ncbi:NAD(P)/FAD-dependent oxidoreductase [Chloroflexi bacterium TSY]|nr:NAD(P)/FAD-dependent oxidoreductase [Chloroflexi bacterium TSY]
MLCDVIIIGGGVIGCAIARELMRYRLRVALLDKEAEVGFGTSKANSGIIHGGHHAAPDTLKGKLEWVGNQMWDSLCDELGFGFKRIGELTVALHEDQLPELHKLLYHAKAKGILGVEQWDRERILHKEPNLTDQVVAAVYAPTTAVINPYEAVFGLAESAVRNGLHLTTSCLVTALSETADGWVIHSNQGDFQARFIINAAGLFSDEVASMAGVGTFTIHPRKGEEYLLDKRLRGLVKRVIFPCPTPVSKGVLVIPTFDGTIMVGPTAYNTNDKEEQTTTMAGGEEVFASVRQLVPGISERDCIAEFAGLRAPADGEDFIIGPTAKRGFINVAGIQSPGLTAAPAIAEMVIDILRDEGLQLARNKSFIASLPQPVHFAALSTEEQIALAARDPLYGRLICRCETVTEGEVVDAIQRGAHTLDGIKFRTRAGMGRCQGGFCTERCMELLARERDIPIAAVTKKGGASWIVQERAEVPA